MNKREKNFRESGGSLTKKLGYTNIE